MENYRSEIWSKWQKQSEQQRENAIFVELNNTYLRTERKEIPLTITSANRMRVLVDQLYRDFEPLRIHWLNELTKLPNWNNI